MYMSTLPPPFGAFGWIYFAKIRVLYDIGICFSKKSFFLEKVTGEEIKFYIESKYSKQKVNTFNCHARALRAFFNYLERDGYLIANPARNIKPKKVRKEKVQKNKVCKSKSTKPAYKTRHYKNKIIRSLHNFFSYPDD